MSDQDNIFNTETKQEQSTQQQATDKSATSDQGEESKGAKTPDVNAIFKDHLSGIVDDKGEPKYNDVYTALEALKHSQEYIKTLQEENKQYKETTKQADTMEEALRKLTANKEQNDSTKSPELDVDKVRGMTLETLKQYEAEKAAAANENAVSQELVKKFGDVEKAKEAYNRKAEELGVDADTLRSLARRSPKAVLSYFNVQANSFDKNVQGSVNTSALKGSQNASEPRKNIMYGSKSGDVVNAWKAAGQAVLKDLENN